MKHQHSHTVQCEGWWEQAGYGRQPMVGLRLIFDGNRIDGSGTDMVSPFTLSGTIGSDGTVTMLKQYAGGHSVNYSGIYDGEGTMSGVWNIDSFRGRWMIRILHPDEDTPGTITQIVSE